jgi:hypothetical protein
MKSDTAAIVQVRKLIMQKDFYEWKKDVRFCLNVNKGYPEQITMYYMS